MMRCSISVGGISSFVSIIKFYFNKPNFLEKRTLMLYSHCRALKRKIKLPVPGSKPGGGGGGATQWQKIANICFCNSAVYFIIVLIRSINQEASFDVECAMGWNIFKNKF